MICSCVNLDRFIIRLLLTDPNFKPGIFQERMAKRYGSSCDRLQMNSRGERIYNPLYGLPASFPSLQNGRADYQNNRSYAC